VKNEKEKVEKSIKDKMVDAKYKLETVFIRMNETKSKSRTCKT
jgi:hypothetical protein